MEILITLNGVRKLPILNFPEARLERLLDANAEFDISLKVSPTGKEDRLNDDGTSSTIYKLKAVFVNSIQ